MPFLLVTAGYPGLEEQTIMFDQIHQLKTDEFGKFLTSEATEKALVISLKKCEPCDALIADIQALKASGSLNHMAVFKMELGHGEANEQEIISEIGVRHFPTVFYFTGDDCIGKMQGVQPKTHKSSEISLMNWFERARKKAA